MRDLEAQINSNGKRNIGRLQFSLINEHRTDNPLDSHDDDIDMFPHNKGNHVKPVTSERKFSGVETTRGRTYSDREETGKAKGQWTAYRSDLKFPILDSFPDIYDFGAEKPRSAQVHTSICTASSIAPRMLYLRKVVRRLAPWEEIEPLSHGLMNIWGKYDKDHRDNRPEEEDDDDDD